MEWMRVRAFTGAPRRPATRQKPDGWPASARSRALALLGRCGGWLRGRLRPEVVVVRHAAADVGVEVPLHRALGEGLLRLYDLLEDRVVGRLLVRHRVVDLELLLKNRVRRLVEAHLVLRLQLDVVLRVAVDGLPRHVLRRRLE